MERLLSLLILLALISGCNKDNGNGGAGNRHLPDKDIVIMFDNDVHCSVDGYAAFAAKRAEYRTRTPYIVTVSSGDFLTGAVIGNQTRGEAIVEIMNRVGYDFVAPGNHEFEYGISRLFELTGKLDAEVLDCNFVEYPQGTPVFEPYRIVGYGGVKIAFIGFTTPGTLISAPDGTFDDERGNRIYDLCGKDFNKIAQKHIDAARNDGADYVIALSHMGDVPDDDPSTSLTLINGTTGLDAVLDGHSHSHIRCAKVPNFNGKSVILTSTGSHFENIAALVISTDGTITTEFTAADSYSGRDAGIQEFVDMEKEKVRKQYERVVGHTDFPLLYSEGDVWLVRKQEMPIGNFVTDALCDLGKTEIGLFNSGGIAAGLDTGDITMNDLLEVTPFGNMIYVGTLTGQQILDGLEYSVRLLPSGGSGLIQVSGLKFDVDLSIKAEFEFDRDQRLTGVAEGSHRRIRDMLVKENGKFVPIDPARKYRVAGSDYLLIQKSLNGMFQYAEIESATGMSDLQTTSAYLEKSLGGRIPDSYRGADGRMNIIDR